jgi:hypothetical protein
MLSDEEINVINDFNIKKSKNNDYVRDQRLLKLKKSGKKYESSDEDEFSKAEMNDQKFELKDVKNFDVNLLTCAHSSKEIEINTNKHIIDKLEELAIIYENTRDKFRANSYQKAIIAIKRHKDPIKTKEV